MLRYSQTLLFSLFLAVFAGQASAMLIQPDWLDPTRGGVGTNRYAYSQSDPINLSDPSGNVTVHHGADLSDDSYGEESDREIRGDRFDVVERDDLIEHGVDVDDLDIARGRAYRDKKNWRNCGCF